MNRIKITLVLLAIVSGTFLNVHAQNRQEVAAVLDSLNAFKPIMVDSTLVGKSIFNILPSRYNGHQIEVKIHQSNLIVDGMEKHILAAPDQVINGYRVRIYFDNKQDSRNDSETILFEFKKRYPEIPAYRSYQNPFFKVTVGDYRTKSEAIYLLNQIKQDFPSAFVVKDQIQYPL